MTLSLNTSKGMWSLAVLRVSQTTAKVWVGTLFHTLRKPEQACVELIHPDGTRIRKDIVSKDWQRPFRYVYQRFYTTVEFEDLEPGTHYEVEFIRRTDSIYRDIEEWQVLRHGQFDTLPASLPVAGERPFTVALGSCFYAHRDGGQAAGSYRALYERGPEYARPHVTFLTGDQVYLDIGFDSLSFVRSEIRERVADDYAQHWQLLGSILSRGATWMLPDDHEYWNDYPFYDSLIPTLLALKIDDVRQTWTKASEDGVRRIQQSPRVETFSIDELSFCMADLRSYRDDERFLPDADFKKLTNWARGLKGPGVLVIPQPLIVAPNPLERNLLSYRGQYSRLLEALGHSGHDIVVMSGDVHFGRIATTTLGPNGGKLVEVIASPLSNLTFLDGVATSTPELEPGPFPHASVRPSGWSSAPVQCSDASAVSVRNGWLLSAYPRDRTTEHFMTAAFQRNTAGGVSLKVDAWRVRDRDDANLPKRDFATFDVSLT